MVCNLVIEVQKLLNNGPREEDSLERSLSIQFLCHKSEEGRGYGRNNEWVYLPYLPESKNEINAVHRHHYQRQHEYLNHVQ